MRRPTIKTSLASVLSIICFAAVMLSYAALSNIATMQKSTSEIGNYWMERLLVARELKGEFSDIRLSLARHLMAADKTAFASEQAALAEFTAKMQDAIARYEAGTRTEKGRSLINEVKPLLSDYLASSRKYTELVAGWRTSDAVLHFNDVLKPKAALANEKINELVEFIVLSSGARVTAADTDASTAFTTVICLATFVIAVCTAGMYFVFVAVARPIETITSSMRKLSHGDDKAAIPFAGRADEIGDMAAAVEIFRQNALANKALEQEADGQRRTAEEERRMAANADRLRADAMTAATAGLATGLKHLASGDLSFQLCESFSDDFESLRADFNAAVAQLSETLTAVANATSQIDSGTREISQSADDLSKRTEQQASSLEETSAALDQITRNVADSSKRVEEARAVAIEANASAATSGDVVANAVGAMQKIQQSSNQIANIITSSTKSPSKQIFLHSMQA